jgi:ABC transporter substrate binding protein
MTDDASLSSPFKSLAPGRAALSRRNTGAGPDVIFAAPTNAVLPLQRETRSIPIVFARVSDPLVQGIVDSLSRPTGNVDRVQQPGVSPDWQVATDPQGYRTVHDAGWPDDQHHQCRFGSLVSII